VEDGPWTYPGVVADPHRFEDQRAVVDAGILTEAESAGSLPTVDQAVAKGEAALELAAQVLVSRRVYPPEQVCDVVRVHINLECSVRRPPARLARDRAAAGYPGQPAATAWWRRWPASPRPRLQP